jgi:hypothetical protein
MMMMPPQEQETLLLTLVVTAQTAMNHSNSEWSIVVEEHKMSPERP